MTDVFDWVLKIVAGFAATILTCAFVEIDWQLAIASIRDATSNSWVPTLSVDVDLDRLNRAVRGFF